MVYTNRVALCCYTPCVQKPGQTWTDLDNEPSTKNPIGERDLE